MTHVSGGPSGDDLPFGASVAFAGEEESKTFFAKGRELRIAGKCREAIPYFQKAFETFPDGIGSLRNIAECQVELKQYASARRSYWDLRRAAMGTTQSKYADWASDAEKEYKRLEPLVSKLVIKVKDAGQANIRITVNGQPLDMRLLDSELEQDVGEIIVVLEDGSAVPPKQVVELKEGERIEVELAATPKTKEKKDEGASPLLIAGGVSLGLAGLSIGGLIGSIVVRQNALDAVDQACPSYNNCSTELRDEVDTGNTTSLLVNVFAVTTGVFAALGAALIVTDVVTSDSNASGGVQSAWVNLQADPMTSTVFVSLEGRLW